LDATGIVIVPGAGFKQKEGSLHFRTTFLPAEEEMVEAYDRLATFHSEFFDTYR
jgi:alanine transaminase